MLIQGKYYHNASIFIHRGIYLLVKLPKILEPHFSPHWGGILRKTNVLPLGKDCRIDITSCDPPVNKWQWHIRLTTVPLKAYFDH